MAEAEALNILGLRQALLAIERGECTALDIIEACFDRIEAREPEVGAWQLRLSREAYLQQYRQQQAAYEASPLKGLPVGIKDIIDTAAMPTEMGSSIHTGRQPVDDASCVAMLHDAGAITLGKTVTTEFAYFKPGKTANPRDLTRTPGGSSSGSAAAVADGMVPIALGSQTAASVIRPAAYCGAVGFVASRGELSLRGVQPLAQSLDSLGLFARRVEDIQLLHALLLRQAQPLSFEAEIKPRRIALCPGQRIGESSAEMNDALNQLAERLQAAGVDCVQVAEDGLLEQMVEHHQRIMAYEVARNLAYESRFPDQLSEPLSQLIDSGLGLEHRHYLDSLLAAQSGCEQLWSQLGEVDAILAPAAPSVAPLGQGKTGAPHMSRPWQAMGLPVITVPGMQDDAGLPLGVQLIGRARNDALLLQQALWLESLIAAR
ncbi:Aspartyl-tRNA(Asn) amidotransferase [Marinobacterium lacunae]|uniref:Aspartyl-tRNA(Asn) amidotransferase n=1 Tax=Marinobacterium lacunae TaxID=1232683 RepID=A0A081FZH1_9GAMM|nr:amidase [Marinobacterium lacunae]KEA63926.1 Aspartyl-tRNA(Asn) amidotransferase [Marinobacterium lacunae]